jgi:pimeloyl-ACP methyl ester carboxylesterase
MNRAGSASLIEAEGPAPNDSDGIRDAVAATPAALQAGARHEAARCFIDHWMGSGSWANTPQERKAVIADSVVNVRRWAHALFTEPTSISEFGQLEMPVLYLTGGRSTQSAHGVARRLVKALPNVTHVDLADLGHMGPITDPEVVNRAIEDFLLRSV